MDKTNLKYALYYSAFASLAHLPFCVLYWISDVIRFYLHHIAHYRLRIVRQNLQSSFPEARPEELKTWEKEFYSHLADNMVETIKLLHISDKQVADRIKVENAELIDAIAQRGHSVVVLLGHYGNWEWVPYVTKHYKAPLQAAQIYKPLRDVAFDRLMLRVRSRFDTESIPQKMAVRRMLDMRSKGQFLVGFVADHRSNSKLTNNWVTFMGKETPFNTGGETIGNKCGAEYVYLDVRKTARGRYTMRYVAIEPKDMSVDYPYTREYYRLLEQTIRQAPPYWLWSHRRWLYTKETVRKIKGS